MNGIEIIAALRGGHPEKCDFCGEPFTDKRQPVPEEAGDWACTECCEQWEKLRGEIK